MEDLKVALKSIKPVDDKMAIKAQGRLDNLTKPLGSLGRLEEFARRLVSIYREEMPECPKKVIFTFAGDHGVALSGVSAFPREVTPQMVLNFLRGGAGINVLARHAGADVAVVDVAVDYDFGNQPGLINEKIMRGTGNIAHGPAMSREDTVRAIEVGIRLANIYAGRGYRMFGTGDMGIGNTTPSTAISAVLTGIAVADLTGHGTGITDEALVGKIKIIEQAISVNRPNPDDAIDVMAKVGGAEIAAIAGLCIGGAACGVPVVVDGFISTAGALAAVRIEPRVMEYLFFSHKSVERGHELVMNMIGARPMLDMNLRLGEGTGAALAMSLIEAGLKIYREMATFGEAGVSGREA